jgi:IclR family acetate operon transcriptional repressor
MLAWLPEHEIRRILALTRMTAFTPNTITDPDVLIEQLRLVRRNGHAMDREEFQPGVVCIGAAIRDHLGAVVGAISASTPTLRGSDEHLTRVREAVMVAARELSTEFGAQAADSPQPESSNGQVN